MKNPHVNTLFLECRGCYFWKDDKINTLSDVGNYRVGVYDYPITLDDGRKFILEFGSYTRKEMRYTHKRTGAPLLHPKYETVLENALHIDTEFENERGCWRDLKIENYFHDKKLTFTKANILAVVNELSVKKFDRVITVSNEDIIARIPAIYKKGGFREKFVIDNLTEVRTAEYSKDYHVFKFIATDGHSFEYEYNTDRITG